MFLIFTCTKFRVKLVWSLDAAQCHTWVISTLSIAHNTFCLGFCTQIHSICLQEASQYMSWSLTTDKSLRFHIAAVHPAVISYKKNSGESLQSVDLKNMVSKDFFNEKLDHNFLEIICLKCRNLRRFVPLMSKKLRAGPVFCSAQILHLSFFVCSD
jgi:hypothetical protein